MQTWMKKGWFVLAVVACLALVAAACTSGRVRTSGGSSRAVNLLVVVGEDDNIYTVRPDGSQRVALTDDASGERVHRQPTWSPSAQRLAWVELDTRSGRVESALVTSRRDGRDRTMAATDSPPFYIYWSPDGSRLAHLSGGTSTLLLQLVDVANGGKQSVQLDQGQPYYFSWSPDSRYIISHIGLERLVLVSRDGKQSPITKTLAPFAAPQWSVRGSNLVYAVRDGSEQRLVVASSNASDERAVASFEGFVTFALSPDSRHVSYAVTNVSSGTNAFGPLYLVNLSTSQVSQLSSEPVIAFFWSPDGRKLLFLRPEVVGGTEVWLRWHVWDGTNTVALGRFIPSPVFFQDYIPFFDQYARSMTLWSPDSSAFVYPGRGEDNSDGIWVQRVLEGEQPKLVTPGLFAAWSPR